MNQHGRRFSFTLVLAALGATCGYFQAGSAATACGVPLTVQDIQSGIMPSDANLPCRSDRGGSSGATQQNRGPSPEQVQRQARWRRADQLNREANDARDRRDQATAIALYEQALQLIKANGDQGNYAVVQRNLAIARKEYAAIANDNRVKDAQSRLKDQNVYTKPNPFAAPTAGNRQVNGNSNEDCYWDERGRPCHPGAAPPAGNAKANAPDSLRERLKRSLESDDGTRDDSAAVDRNEINTANRSAPPPQKPQDLEPAKAPPSRDDDPLKNYLDSDNRSGSQNNGTLTNRDPKFEMSGSETRREMDRMQGVVQVPRGADGQQIYGPPVPDEGQARK